MSNEKFPFGTFVELFNFTKSLGITKIERIYSQKDYERLRRGSSWVWNVYSPEQVKENLSIFLAHLDNVYTCMINQNFPEIKNDLPIFGIAKRIIVIFTVEENYENFHGPSIQFYYLVDESLDKIVFELYSSDEVPEISTFHPINWNASFSIKERNYKIVAASDGVLDFIFDDTPMMNYCYELLENNLKRYFEKDQPHKIHKRPNNLEQNTS
jgi:hypothetical protein